MLSWKCRKFKKFLQVFSTEIIPAKGPKQNDRFEFYTLWVIDENIHFPPRFHFTENSLWLHLQRVHHNLSCKFKAFPIYKETNVKLTNKGVPFLLKKMLEIDLIFTIKPFFSRKIFWLCLFPNFDSRKFYMYMIFYKWKTNWLQRTTYAVKKVIIA